jgi:hypothetical protein
MKHRLIPTDFTIRSLHPVHQAVSRYASGKEQISISLFHLMSTRGEIAELLFPSMRHKHLELVNESFKEACQILENRYSTRLVGLQVKFGFGDTVSYLRNFLEGEGVDVVVCCPDITWYAPSPRSIPMIKLLKKTGVHFEALSQEILEPAHTGINVLQMKPDYQVSVAKL